MTTPTAHPRPDSVRAILLAATDLLDRPGAWTQHELARDADGDVTGPSKDNAVSWCTIGAIMRVARTDERADARARLAKTLERAGHDSDITCWNDAPERTQTEVVAMLRRVAEEEA